MSADQEKWDRIYREKNACSPQVSEVLLQNQHLLPQQGLALDLACGLGANALFLAQRNLQVMAWDISPVAITHVKQAATNNHLNVLAEVRDIYDQALPQNEFDVIVVTHFLARDLKGALIEALKPSGLLFYQTYCQLKVSDIGPRNPEYLLADNELLSLFAELRLCVYREESLLGNIEDGWRNQAMLVAQKR